MESPILAGLGKKAVLALGGAAFGAGLVLLFFTGGENGPSTPSSPEDSRLLAIAIGAGAAVGFVLGSVVGTFAGAQETREALEARERVFERCMRERGYQMPRPWER